MKLIAGLGNPGKQYQQNRHNVGFQIVDLLAARHGLRFDVKQGKAQVALGVLNVQVAVQQVPLSPEPDALTVSRPVLQALRVALAKPQTFMNLVGPSVQALLRFYKIDPADLLVIYDDLDLPLGALRLRATGGAGGHNGMKSLIGALGSGDFNRLRVGIDRPPGRMDPAAYVLQDFSTQQEEVMARTREQAADACQHWLAHGIVSAMNVYNAGVET
ncbi:MAG: aminoacyl-tRNA hydrolase [Anaerolineae bacterium]